MPLEFTKFISWINFSLFDRTDMIGESEMIRKAEKADAHTVAKLAIKMWSDSTEEILTNEFETLIADETACIFLCYEKDTAVGFAQCQLRNDYVEGTSHSPVGYLEGIFVEKSCRNRGYAKRLLDACERWAKDQGCMEFASDCELDNRLSQAFHLHSGFMEANRIICYVKKL